MKDVVGKYTLEVMQSATWYNDWLFRIVKKDIKGQILEIGSGIGNFTPLLAECGNVTATDYNARYLKDLKKRFKTKKVNVGFGDIEKGKYFFKHKKFDTIICFNVLEHIKNDSYALKNIFKLIKRDGKLLLLTPAHNMLFSEFDRQLGHYRRYSKSSLLKVIKRVGFTKVKIKYINWWSAVGWLVFLKLTGRKDIPKNNVKIFNYFGRLFLWPENFVKPPFGLSVLAQVSK